MSTDVQTDAITVPPGKPISSRPRMNRARSRISVSLICEFERYNPCRSPAWRWKLAEKIIERGGRRRPGRADEHLGRAVKFQKRLGRCRTPGRLNQLRAADPDLFAALELFQAGGWQRVLLEALLLAAVPPAEIAQRHELSEGTIETYVKMFYDVVERLKARDYILGVIRRPLTATGGLNSSEHELKVFGYFMGPAAVDAMARLVFDEQGRLLHDKLDVSTSDGRLAALLRLAMDARSPAAKSLIYMVEILRTVNRISEIGKSANQAADFDASKFAETEGASGDIRPNMDAVIALLLAAAKPKSLTESETDKMSKDSEDRGGDAPSRKTA